MARTTASARWQRIQPATAPNPVSSPTVTPLYDQLVREWAAADRTLPGLPDMEWSRLVLYPAQSVGDPDGRPGPPPQRRGWLHDRHPV